MHCAAKNERKLNVARASILAQEPIMSELIRVQCPKCGGTMKEKAKKIRGGYSMACTHCSAAIVFESGSDNSAIRQALSLARRLRRQTLAVA
jgi:hypothetical protein